MRVTFGGVTCFNHERILDGSKLPSDGRVPLGLGGLVCTEEHSSIEDFEEAVRLRKQDGDSEMVLWFHVPPSARTGLLARDLQENLEELTALEKENADILLSKSDSKVDMLERREGHRDEVSHKRSRVEVVIPPQYSTAREGDERTGAGGGFCEVALEQEAARRRQLAESENLKKEARKADRKKCMGCHRFACICC